MKGHQRNALLKPARNLRGKAREKSCFQVGISFSCLQKGYRLMLALNLVKFYRGLSLCYRISSVSSCSKRIISINGEIIHQIGKAWGYQRGKLLVGNELTHLHN